MVAYDIRGSYPANLFHFCLTISCIEKTKRKKKSPGMAYFVALRFLRRYNMHVAHLGIQDKKRN